MQLRKNCENKKNKFEYSKYEDEFCKLNRLFMTTVIAHNSLLLLHSKILQLPLFAKLTFSSQALKNSFIAMLAQKCWIWFLTSWKVTTYLGFATTYVSNALKSKFYHLFIHQIWHNCLIVIQFLHIDEENTVLWR